ncbi:unnamed protein product [Nesidiocoris tenuis]|uniref:Reverse transcriptase domain-containing protein n=1 Tax=Nesidiocoris tenuis TaxID=355587 RepID=A0A6H5GVI8_9HEMI|nr:unnamed protein product [Nesidiocoris tenuis]
MFLKRQFPLLASCAQFNWVSLRRDLGLPDTFDLPDFTRRAKSSLCPMGFKQFRLAEAAISKRFDPPIPVRTSILRICGARLEIRLGGERLPVERKMAYDPPNNEDLSILSKIMIRVSIFVANLRIVVRPYHLQVGVHQYPQLQFPRRGSQKMIDIAVEEVVDRQDYKIWYKRAHTLRQVRGICVGSHQNTDYSLWKATKHLKRPTVQAPPIKNPTNNEWFKTNQEKADIFSRHLANTFKPFPGSPDEPPLEEVPLTDTDVKIPLVTVKEVQKTINSEINPKKAPGYDLITGQILKYLPRKAIVKITQIINAAIKLRYVPQLWKLAEVIMILKPGKPPEEVSSYRPISLLPVLSKLFEKLIHKRLIKVVAERKLIPAHQFGFRHKHSTIDQVHRITYIIEQALENKKVCSAVFLDVSQAFDRVWHKGLNYKLKKLLPAQYAEIMQSYLSDRFFRIRYENACSGATRIQAGVPQGSVLGPLLYVLYTSDLPEREENTLATFADDTAILAVGETNYDTIPKLERSLKNLQNWTTKWRIKMNEMKSVHVDFTNKRIDYLPLRLNAQVIPHANEAKYLGITMDARLRWKHHIKKKKVELTAKFRKMYWLIGRKSKLSIQNKLTLYNQVLKPVWTYGAQLWGCTAPSNREIIQRFQNNVLRSIVDAYRYTRNARLHLELKVPLVDEVIRNQALAHQKRLIGHVNEEAVQLLDVDGLVRRLKRTKPHDLWKQFSGFSNVVKIKSNCAKNFRIKRSAGGTSGGVRRQRRRLHRQKVILGAEDCGCKQSDNGALMSRRAGDGRYQARQAGDFWVERAVSMTTQTSILPLVPGGGGRQEARGQELESGGCGEKSASIASRVTLGQSPTSASLTPEHTPSVARQKKLN